MKLNKIFLLVGIAVSCMFASCNSDDHKYEFGPKAEGSQLQTVTFGENNIQSIELDPNDECSCIWTVYRDSAYIKDAASVPLKIVTNTDNVFSVPATAEFAAGKAEADVVVTFPKADVGVPYELEVAIDDSYVHPYKTATYSTYSLTVQRVKWNLVGDGYIYDDFWFGFEIPVQIYQRDDDPSKYRITNPYTDDFMAANETTSAGTWSEWISINVGSNGYLDWNPFSYNVYYGSYAAEILPKFRTGNAENCYVVENDEGGVRYFQLNPYFYMDGVGGWNDYCLYIVFPGQRFPDFYYEK